MAKAPSVSGHLKMAEDLIAKGLRDEAKIGDPFSLVEDRTEDKLVEERDKEDLGRALKDAAVRRLLFRILNMTGILADASDPNPIVMAHFNGRRAVGLELYRAIKDVDGGAFYQMEREARSNAMSVEKENGE